MPTLTKCDVVAWLDGRYVEVTNYFQFSFQQEVSKEQLDKPWASVDPAFGGVFTDSCTLISPELPSYEQVGNFFFNFVNNPNNGTCSI